jgi:hemerythrin superfamily protein
MGNSAIATGKDVVAFLTSQHARINALFEKVIGLTNGARESAFVDLRRLMAVHETAEEEIVHPMAARVLGKKLIEERLREEHEAKRALAELEALGTGSLEFGTKLRLLHTSVLAHAEAEEHEELAKLADALEQGQLVRMRRAVEIAEALAPTHPHAGFESATANLLVWPFASIFDRARDVIAGKA